MLGSSAQPLRNRCGSPAVHAQAPPSKQSSGSNSTRRGLSACLAPETSQQGKGCSAATAAPQGAPGAPACSVLHLLHWPLQPAGHQRSAPRSQGRRPARPGSRPPAPASSCCTESAGRRNGTAAVMPPASRRAAPVGSMQISSCGWRGAGVATLLSAASRLWQPAGAAARSLRMNLEQLVALVCDTTSSTTQGVRVPTSAAQLSADLQHAAHAYHAEAAASSMSTGPLRMAGQATSRITPWQLSSARCCWPTACRRCRWRAASAAPAPL